MQVVLLLQRDNEYGPVVDSKGRSENSTLGVLRVIVDGVTVETCVTCENEGPSTDEPMKDKRIMPGIYKLSWAQSSKNDRVALGKWKNRVIWLRRDPAFDKRLIRIHSGNYPSDTEGCILLGEHMANGYITGSTSAIIRIFNLVEKLGIANCKMEIREKENR